MPSRHDHRNIAEAQRQPHLFLVAVYWSVGVLITSSASSAIAAPCATFQGLGILPNGSLNAGAFAVSADGSTVVGFGTSPVSFSEASRWTLAGGMVGLGDLPGGMPNSQANAVSADGSTVVGEGDAGAEAFRWTAAGGMVGLGFLPGGSTNISGTGESANQSRAFGVSGDGSTIVGDTTSAVSVNFEAFRWTAAEGMVGLGFLPGSNTFFSSANAISTDGSTIVGNSSSAVSFNEEAFRWTAAEGMVGLGNLSGGLGDSTAFGVSADGSVIVGTSVNQAFRWTSAGGMIGLGSLNNTDRTEALGVSADGSVVVGRSIAGGSSQVRMAFIWDAENGMRPLRDVLVNEYGLDLSGWDLFEANGISDDGLTIVGNGMGFGVLGGGWIVTMSKPGEACEVAGNACGCGSGMDGMMVMPITLLGMGWMRRPRRRR